MGVRFGASTVKEEIERIEVQYLKYILHLPKNATNSAVRGELGQFPLHLFWKENIIKYWCGVNTDDIPKYLKLAVNIHHEMLKNSKLCWLSKIQNIYNSAGLSCKFSSAGTESTKQHVNEVMMRLSDQFIQDWFNQINKPEGKKGSNKLRTYKLFKDNFELEYYLTAVPTVRYRIALTKICVSCHRLAIETGRYQKPTSLPINQRLCTLCNQVEDEIHLICVCKRNAHLRIDFFSFVQSLYPSFQFMLPKEKVIYIMQNKDFVVINNFAAFIYRSLLLVKTFSHPGCNMSLKYNNNNYLSRGVHARAVICRIL